MPNAKTLNKLITISRELVSLPDSRKKHFSFILLRNKILSVGYNQSFKTHPLAKKFGTRYNSLHSETAAIINFPFPIKRLNDCVLVNVRIMLDGSIGLSKPCQSCQGMLYAFGFESLLFSTDNGWLEL